MSQLSAIMKSITPIKIEKPKPENKQDTPNRENATVHPSELSSPSAASNLYQAVKSTITIQRWWRRWRLFPLFSQVLTLEEDLNSTCPVSSSWIFLQKQDISDDLRSYCNWHTTRDRRLGKWRFYPPQHLFRTKEEKDFLLATLIWSNGVTRTPNSNHGEILYDPVLETFAIVQDDTRTFSSFTELLRHMHVLDQLELRRIQRAIITIQRAWTSSAAAIECQKKKSKPGHLAGNGYMLKGEHRKLAAGAAASVRDCEKCEEDPILDDDPKPEKCEVCNAAAERLIPIASYSLIWQCEKCCRRRPDRRNGRIVVEDDGWFIVWEADDYF